MKKHVKAAFGYDVYERGVIFESLSYAFGLKAVYLYPCNYLFYGDFILSFPITSINYAQAGTLETAA